ncbi:hypothetical protein BY996DRAFT_7511399, partial [Phakopsora pachyrhizi]
GTWYFFSPKQRWRKVIWLTSSSFTTLSSLNIILVQMFCFSSLKVVQFEGSVPRSQVQVIFRKFNPLRNKMATGERRY